MSSRKRILVIGGYGHIGTFLVPQLVSEEFNVTVLTRGNKLLPDFPEWEKLSPEHVKADYNTLCENGEWEDILKRTGPDIVIDILAKNTPMLHQACPASVEHLIITGSLWMYGIPEKVPVVETLDAQNPFDGYKKRYEELATVLRSPNGPAVTGIMPSNISGPGKIPLEPYGGRSRDVHKKMAAGEEIILPFGGNTLVGPTDAEDVANVFALAVLNSQKAAGRIFNAAPSYSITYNELVRAYGECYNTDIPVTHGTVHEFQQAAGPEEDKLFHHRAHMCADITAAKEILGYTPRHTPEEAVARAVEWMKSHGMIP